MAIIEFNPDGTIITANANFSAVTGITGSIASVAAAVEQQSAATSEIASTMQTPSVSISSINRFVGNIAASMDERESSATRATDQVRTNILRWSAKAGSAASAARAHRENGKDAERENERYALNQNLHAREPHSP